MASLLWEFPHIIFGKEQAILKYEITAKNYPYYDVEPIGLNEEIRKLNTQLLEHQQIKKVRVRDKEFDKTTAQKIKSYLVQQEDSTH